MTTAILQTAAGTVRGVESDGLRIFRGIPYAQPPLGFLRFQAPQPITNQRDLDATKFGAIALQNPDRLDYIWGGYPASPDEDCLTLNIWAPSADGPLRPVMVWIHGGAFVFGSGSSFWYEGARLARRGNVVVVTINYRLGVFGFLNLSGLGDTRYTESANCGLLDQIAALGWVKENIAAFGGDPANITVFGESAGGASITCLMAMPRARGLFQRAIVQSGGPNLVHSAALSTQVAQAFLHLAGVARPEDLQQMPTAELLQAQARLLAANDFGGDAVFGPTVDGVTLPRPPLHAIRDGSAAEVTLLTGMTRDEFRLWILTDPILRWCRPSALRRWLQTVTGTDGTAILNAYRTTRPNATAAELTMAIFGDAVFRFPLVRLAEAQGLHRRDTRMYLFAWLSPAIRGIGAPHCIEIPFVFGNLGASGVANLTGDGTDRAALSEAIQDAWINFARTGNPEHAGLPAWPAYADGSRATMIFDLPCRMEHDPGRAERAAWGAIPFDGVEPPMEVLPTMREFTWSAVFWPAVIFAGLLLVGVLALIWL